MRSRRLFAVALTFALALAVFAATRGGERAAAGPPAAAAPSVRPDADTDASLRRLQDAVRRGAPREAELAAAYIQKARETGDPTYITRADGVLRRALARGPDDPAELAEAATLAAERHDFAKAERLARRAGALAPDSIGALPILVDALVELGRYREAERTLQRLVDLKPNLSSYARVSYFRELTGDLRGAAEALRLAIAAGGPVRENVAYAQSLLGSLELGRGHLAAARRAYAAALEGIPGYAPALVGRARLAARSGNLPGAIARWRDLAARHALPEHAIALGEAELAAGRTAAGRAHVAEGVAQEAQSGHRDVDAAITEADHGDPQRALKLARAVWDRAPSVRSADAVGWALTRAGRPRAGLAWARRALKLGSVDPMFRYHAGVAAVAAGRDGRRDLRLALRHGLGAYPLHAKRARAALEAG